MGFLIQEDPWTSQPQYPVAVRPELADRLQRFVSFGAGTSDLISRSALTLGSNVLNVNEHGQALQQRTARQTSWAEDGLGSSLTSGISVIFTAKKIADIGTTSNFIIGQTDATAADYAWGFYEASATGLMHFYIKNTGGTGASAIIPVAYWTVGRGLETLIATYGDGDNNIRIYADGQEIASAAQTGNIKQTTLPIRVASWQTGEVKADIESFGVWSRNIGPEAAKWLSEDRLRIFAPQQHNIWVPVAGGATVIDLVAAALGFTPKTSQLDLTNRLSTASLNLTPQPTQSSLVARITAATFDFVANAITVTTSTTATIIDLTAATFGFVAQSTRLSLQNNLAAASFDLAALPVTNRLAVKMTTALLTFAAQPTQNLLRLGLTAASLRFVARAITVTGAISGAIKQFMTLMGVGK